MGSRESPLAFLSRACLIRHTKRQYDVVIPRFEANRRIVRRLSSDFEIRRGLLNAIPEIDTITLERTRKTAHGGIELSRSRVGSPEIHYLAIAFHSDSSVGQRISGVEGGGGKQGKSDECCTDHHHHNHHPDSIPTTATRFHHARTVNSEGAMMGGHDPYARDDGRRNLDR